MGLEIKCRGQSYTNINENAYNDHTMKIAVLTSGGVDSSVALQLLKQAGHDVTAFYLKIWLEDELSYLGDCPWEQDLDYVRTICRNLDVPLEVVPMQREYWDTIVKYVLEESKKGRTPNPDVLCNQFVKFGLFYEKIGPEFEKVATGHYAQIEEKNGLFWLKKAPDPIKDQTYFLARLSQKQLSRALFPIGHLQKNQVRQLAHEFDLPNRDRKDSQGICFLGKFKYRDFIAHHLGELEGDFVDVDTGKVVGRHKGYWFYTIGQRNGLGLSGGPWFVIKKDVAKNIIYLANGYEPDSVNRDTFEVEDLGWIAGPPEGDDVTVRIRHGGALIPAALKGSTVILRQAEHGVAPGQFAVFYQGDYCLGSGIIA